MEFISNTSTLSRPCGDNWDQDVAGPCPRHCHVVRSVLAEYLSIMLNGDGVTLIDLQAALRAVTPMYRHSRVCAEYVEAHLASAARFAADGDSRLTPWIHGHVRMAHMALLEAGHC